MMDRGMKKWNPFDSLISSKDVIRNISITKDKVEKPVLSLEQLEEIQETIWEAFHSEISVTMTYFHNGLIHEKKNKILEIKPIAKKIFFCDSSFLYFEQILRVQLG